MKKIYIILTHTGTILSRIIKMYTKDEFSHASIALDVELNEMYSFGRLNPYNPFLGGFVHEHIERGTFKRFYKTKAKVYALNVTDKQYQILCEKIKEIESKKKEYKFNVIGLFAAGFHKKIGREKSFYCAEFVKEIIERAGISINLPEVVKPDHFKKIKGIQEIYSGLLRKYKSSKLDLEKVISALKITKYQSQGNL